MEQAISTVPNFSLRTKDQKALLKGSESVCSLATNYSQ